MAAPAKPAAVDAKKSTSKVDVPAPARPAAPQATVKIGGPSAPAATPSATVQKAAPVESASEGSDGSGDQSTGLLAIAATIVALAALGIQLWMYL